MLFAVLALFADDAPTVPVIQVSWQGLAAAGASIGGSIIAAAKILAIQWKENSKQVNDGIAERHAENRQDTLESRKENRELSQAILVIQGKTVETLTMLQSEINKLVLMIGKVECKVRPDRPDPPKSG